MKKHLQTNKLIRVFLTAVLIGFVGTSNLFAAIPPEGALNGLFTVNASGDQVGFSQGNLQYIGSASTPYWKFADHQWDCLDTITGQNSSEQNVDRDLFGWGTSGYNHGAICYEPWSTSNTYSDYYAYGSHSYNLYDQTGQADWGYNAISNGGNMENSGWRTLTKDEWDYVFNTRNTDSGKRYAKATVNEVYGYILLPDGWDPSIYSLSNTNYDGASYTSNVINSTQWPILEQAGAVFLPAAGVRSGTKVYFGYNGGYWSASFKYSSDAYGVSFNYYPYDLVSTRSRSSGLSVRLVFPVENYSLNINTTPNPLEGGTVSGGGAYQLGTSCTVTATPAMGYVFVNWAENGTIYSTNATHTFNVIRDRSLVANFVQEEGNVAFSDANVKALCVTNWDTNGDGELSYVEAANVTSLGNVFKNKTSINSFNELQYFIGLGSIDEQAFYGCTALTQVTIPANVVSVGGKAFWNCPALQTVRFNAINCTSMKTTYNNQTYSVFSSDASGGTPAVKSVVIANGVTRIPDYAFMNCAQIYPGMTIRSSVTKIGAHAFENCSSMTTLSFQSNSTLATISDYAFSGCSALNKALNLPNSVTTIGQYAFYGCVAIPSLTIGTGMRSIGGYAFWDCPAMTLVNFNAMNCTSMVTNNAYSVFNSGTSIDGVTPIVTLTIGDNVSNIPDYAFRNSANMTSVITIPDMTEKIGRYAFYGVQSQELTIGEYVTTIGEYAFWNCPQLQTVHFNATNCTSMYTQTTYYRYSVFNSGTDAGGTTPIVTLTIGENVTKIPAYAFFNSTHLTSSITIPDATISIGQYAFGYCSLIPSMLIGDGVSTIGASACYGCSSLGLLTIGEGVTTIGEYAFWNCPNLATVHFNATNCTSMYTQITDYRYSVFNSGTDAGGTTPIVTLTIGENVTKIPEYALYNSTNLTSSITIPDATISIGQYAFGYCSLIPSMLIGDGVSTIGASACYGCSSLGLLTIGEGVTTIGEYAFWNCPALATVHFNATNCTSMYTQINDFRYSVFNSGTDAGGATPIVTLIIGDNVTKIPDYAFNNSRNAVGSLLLPDVLTYLGESAFWGCNSFTGDLAIPNTVTSIGDDAFNGCSGFNGTLTLPVNVGYQTIRSGTFYGCTGLMGTLTIPANVTEIESSAFRGCSGFSGSLVLHDAITFIGQYAFYGCSSIDELTIGEGVTTIGQYAFYGCSSIDELTIGEGVTTIGDYAFWNCPNLATVHFNATNCTTMVTNSQYSVFNAGTSNGGNTPIVNLTIGENVTKIPNYAFRNSNNMMGDLIIPNSVTSIGTYAFAYCSGHNVFTGKSVTSIPNYAFFGSSFNGTLMLGDALASIGQYAFRNCSSFTGDLVIPNAVTTMGQYAFSGCSGFNGSLILGNGIQTINQKTFDGCSSFSGALILGTQVNSIANTAFQNCSAFSLLITENANPVTATSSSFTGMTYTIPVYVPDGLVSNYQNATGWSSFTNYIEQYTFWQEMDTDNWSDELNWLSMEVPSANDVVCITYDCNVDIDVDVLHVYVYNINDVLTVQSGKTLNATYGVGVVQPSQLVMEEGSQLYNTIPGVSGTVKKQISGYGTGNDGWYTIAAPIYAGMPVNTLATGNYDLYAYDEPTAMWLNQKVPGNFDELNPAQGYLYASQTGRTANFAGQLNASNAEISIPVTYTSGELAGFNLVGNPYTNNINIGNVKINGTAQTAFYRAEGGSSVVAYVAADNEPIKPGDGFLVKATESGTLTFDFTPSREDAQQGSYVRLVLNKNNQVADRAYLVINEGETLEKMSTANAHSKLYFKNGNDRYAVAENESYNGSMPLYLENAFGRYTIEVSLLNAQCDYLHLIDNITGDNIDLLKTPSYTFMSSPRDREDRFTLVFDAFENVYNEVFAYQNGDDIVVSGNGELQIFDVMGRMVATQRINGVETYGCTSLQTGVYIFRLVGNEVKSQKIVVD